MNKYKSTASYNRINPKTGEIQQTSRFLEMQATNKGHIEQELMKQVKHDEVVGKVIFDTRKVK